MADFFNSDRFEVDGIWCCDVHGGIDFLYCSVFNVDEVDFIATVVELEYNIYVAGLKYWYVIVFNFQPCFACRVQSLHCVFLDGDFSLLVFDFKDKLGKMHAPLDASTTSVVNF